MAKQNTPALRFDGFDGEWNVISLSDHATFSRGKGYSKADVGTGSYPLFLYGQLYTNYSTEIRSITTFSRMNDDSVVSTGREVLMPASDVTPTNIVRASHLKVPGVLLGGDLNVITPGDGIDPTFLALELTGGSSRAELLNNIQGATVKHLHLGPIRKLKLVVPSVKEQRAIGELFADLDALIEQHRAKHANLQQTKTALLQRMFPQEGADEPELRIGGFSGVWESRTLSELTAINNGLDYKHLNEGDIPVYGTGGYMLSVDRALSYEIDAIGIGRKGTIDKPYLLRAPFWTVDTLFYVTARDGANLQFLLAQFQRIDWKSKNMATGVPSLTSVTIGQTMVSLPPTLEEQRAIGEVFSNLDALITAEHRYITQLTQAKTALLQRMFV
ncbi:restriction endonuclease subunit S [Actinomyces sp.]|uniref:restriction endonuclease subunit S n=1 Tax=Actinomyces sp. TaxID=29317 RepID=UPI00290B0009|nr:restriction endonuclease subunit S [Actinomyces sp.]MDU5568215.1 restriction endonuclease subunit S [Actinomyces sp.]